MSTCPQCGQENSSEARFCIKCGGSLGAQAETGGTSGPPEAAPAVEPGPDVPPAAPAPPAAQPPPAAPPRAAAYPPSPPPPGGYTQQPPQAASTPPGYGPPQYAYARGKTRGPFFWAGSSIVLAAGVLVLISTWLSWGTGPGGFLSLSGWDWFDIGRSGLAQGGEVANAFFIYSGGYPIFTGLCSLIIGGLIILAGLLMLVLKSKGMGVIAIIFSIIALGMAVTNLTTILRTEGISMGVGMYLFLIFSATGVLGGSIGTAG